MSDYHIPSIATMPTPTRAPLQFAIMTACGAARLGLTPREMVVLTGDSRATINTVVPMMLKMGRLFCAGPTGHRRYFATLAQADAMRDEVAATIERERAERKAASKAARKEYNRKRQEAHMERLRAERAKIAVPSPAKSPLRAKIHTEVLRRKRGASVAQIMGATRSTSSCVARALSEMHAAGVLWRVGRKREYTYFATREDFNEFGPAIEQKMLMQDEARRSPRHQNTVYLTISRPKEKQKAAFRDLPVVVPAHVKPQPVGGYTGDPRYTVTGPVVGGFATMGIGRYLDA